MTMQTLPGRRSAQHGFSLVELSVVLLVIALIAGAVAVGSDLQRNASYQKLGSTFVRSWQLAYLSYVDKTGVVVLDNQTTPTGYVDGAAGGAAGEVCTTRLRAAMVSAGVDLPQGRAEGKETFYSYLDSNGNPQQVEVCFLATTWSIPTSVDGNGNTVYGTVRKNVMVVKGLTPDLARMVDSLVDTVPDARFGKVRESQYAADTQATQRVYSLTNDCIYGGACTGAGAARDEAQVATLTAYYLMDR